MSGARIIGYIRLGGGFSSYVAYKIEVYDALTKQSWYTYRRYSTFFELHEHLALIKVLDEQICESHNICLPDKVLLPGTFAGTLKSIVIKRLAYLQTYITNLSNYLRSSGAGISANSYLLDFFDFQNKGISGIAVEYGVSKIKLETHGKVKFPADSLIEYPRSYFIILTKDGMLYAVKDHRDNVDAAIIKLSLTSGRVTVSQVDMESSCLNANKLVINCNEAKKKLLLILEKPADFIVWLHAISDATLNGNLNYADSREHRSAANLNDRSTSRLSSSLGIPTVFNKSTDIRHTGTGATADELSALYGV